MLYQLAPAAYPDWITVICPKTRDKYCPISTSGGMPSPLRLQVEFITGIWFEEYVRIMLLSLERDGAFNWDKGPSYPLLSIKDVCSGTVFKINDTTFQSDIMLVKNHRLRYISVTTTSDQAIIKKKMFEAMIRSQQIGGGLARSCVVSLADYDTWENREVADICRDSINDPHHIVFGRPDIMRWHNEHKAPELLQFLTD